MLAVLLMVCLGRTAGAQEFRVYTQVYDEADTAKRSRDGGPPPIVTRSLSMFHAGKVYDYIEPVGEVTVFEPARRRFTILSTSREMTTTVEFDELKHLLKMARLETEKYLTQLDLQATKASQKAARSLRFQLAPRFQEQYDLDKKRLTLLSPYFRYDVGFAAARSNQIADEYLRYADWIARLNYVLHPRALFPEPRLALNRSLRRLGMIPVEVELHADVAGGVHLRAQHQIHWELNSKDRSLIHRWETMLRSKQSRRVTFHEYQRVVVTRSVSGFPSDTSPDSL